jgi:hypothetical protein
MERRYEERQRYQEQANIFKVLYERVESLLERFGRSDCLPGQPYGDFTVHSDYTGNPQVVIFVENLKMLRPIVIKELQNVIRDYPDWQIEVTVAVRDHDHDWPDMGLYIRSHEIIDALQRQYFPKEFQDIEYQGARSGTAYD